jgi:predicted alpha/beta-hydrolase family hydrolase
MTALEVLFPTPVGVAHLSLDIPSRPVGLVVLGHGAGGDVDAPDLLTVREAALALDIAVVRLRQPYRQAGRRAPAPAAQLDVAYAAVLAGIADGTVEAARGVVGLPWVIGGRSSGGRVAARVAAAAGPDVVRGVLALAFPLVPPGRTGVSRLEELLAVPVPTLVVQGSRDGFGSAEAVRAAVGNGRVTVVEIADADHSFRTRRADATTTKQALTAVAAAVTPWIGEVAGLPKPARKAR